MKTTELVDFVLSGDRTATRTKGATVTTRRETLTGRLIGRFVGVGTGFLLALSIGLSVARAVTGNSETPGSTIGHRVALMVQSTPQRERLRHGLLRSDEVGIAHEIDVQEVAITYAYDEPLGEAEVTYIFPADELIPLNNRARNLVLDESSSLFHESVKDDLVVFHDGAMALNGQVFKLAADLAAGDSVLLDGNCFGTIKSIRPVPTPSDEEISRRQVGGYRRVIATIKHTANVVVDITYGGETTTATPDHPFWVVNRSEWIEAAKLRPGDLLRTLDGISIAVESVGLPRHGTFTVYNLEVEGLHTYHAGTHAVLVHNGPCARKIIGVIGHFPEYVQLGKKLGARVLNIAPDVWNSLSRSQQWKRNRDFLYRIIKGGGEFILASDPRNARPGSWFARELEYILSHGYMYTDDFTRLVRR